jgi:hypothetical protein
MFINVCEFNCGIGCIPNTIWGPSESYVATIAFGINNAIVMKKVSEA